MIIARSHPHIPCKGVCANFFRNQMVLVLPFFPVFIQTKIELERGRVTLDNYATFGGIQGTGQYLSF